MTNTAACVIIQKTQQAENFLTEKGSKAMTTAKININTINDVKNFVNIVTTKCEYDVDIVSGRYAIDAKSIMGIFSLDLSKPIELHAHTEDAEKLLAAIDKYIVK